MKKILLIEDNTDLRENTAEILSLSNYEVVTAEHGRKGVELAKSQKPDLIICDIMMPELDGYGVLHILSKDREASRIPFIFLTAKAERADMRKGMTMGADDYLTKPFDDLELLDAVESRLRKQDLFKEEFDRTQEGLNYFLSQARGLEELKALSQSCRTRHYKKKDILFFEGDHPNVLYFIAKGKVKLFKTNDDGKEYITALHGTGDFVGYSALLEDKPYADSAMALEEATVSLIPREDFLGLVHSNREVSQKFISMLSNDLEETEERLLRLAYNSVRKRVSEALVQLVEKYKEADKQEQFSMALSREDLANMVGTAKETVIRTLSDFKEEGILHIKGSQITVLDEAALRKVRN